MKHFIPPALLLFAAACSSAPSDTDWTPASESTRSGAAAQDPAEPDAVVVQIYDVRDLTVVPSDRPLGIAGLAQLLEENVADVGVAPHEDSLLIVHGPAHAHRDVTQLLADLRGE